MEDRVMKKTYIALAVLAMAALAGCQTEEFRDDVYIPEEGEVLIRVSKSDKTTKSAEFISEVRGEMFSLGSDAEGTNYFLEETITNLDDVVFAPKTKGTPAYTENFSDLYGSFNAAVYKDGAVYEEDGTFVEVDKTNLIYKRKYPNDIWNKQGNPNLYFFLRTPVDYISTNTTGLTYSATDGTITFNYTSPAKAEDQKDMLFTSRPLTTASEFNNYFTKANEGLPVLFHHVLTGVKFAIAADVKDKVTITGVKFTGLADGGKCVVTPRQETNGYADDKTGDYSSASVSIWDADDLDFGGTVFSQTFGNTTKDYTSAGTGVAHFGESFYSAGNLNNLNDDNASLTFWLIPQAMTDDVKLTISYTIANDTKPYEWTIDFGTTLKNKNVEWLAGELHTYTIRIDEVNVKIEDTVEPTKEEDKQLTDLDGNIVYKEVVDPETGETTRVPYTYTYYGGTKSNVVITNTGNTDSFIRAALIGQWLDEDGNPVFGFTDYTAGEVVLVDSWYQDQFVTKARKHGSFTGLVGYADDYPSTGKWVLCEDGYYYYTEKVAAGATVPSDDPLFESYTVDKNPAVAVAGKVKDVYFTLEISTQAVTAKKIDGSDYTWDQAWKNALGTAPVQQ